MDQLEVECIWMRVGILDGDVMELSLTIAVVIDATMVGKHQSEGIASSTIRKSAYAKLWLLYGWSLQMRRSRIAEFAKCTIDTVNKTILDWYQMIQEDIQENDCVIDGIDADENPIVAEIDESKFGKRKYNHGYHVEG